MPSTKKNRGRKATRGRNLNRRRNTNNNNRKPNRKSKRGRRKSKRGGATAAMGKAVVETVSEAAKAVKAATTGKQDLKVIIKLDTVNYDFLTVEEYLHYCIIHTHNQLNGDYYLSGLPEEVKFTDVPMEYKEYNKKKGVEYFLKWFLKINTERLDKTLFSEGCESILRNLMDNIGLLLPNLEGDEPYAGYAKRARENFEQLCKKKGYKGTLSKEDIVDFMKHFVKEFYKIDLKLEEQNNNGLYPAYEARYDTGFCVEHVP